MLHRFHLRLKISLGLISMDTSLHPGSTRPLESTKSPVLVHIFAFQCPSTAKWLHFGIQNERIFKPNEACYAITFKCFAWRRIISKQIWPDSTEESFINTLYKTIFTKTDTSVQITVLQSVGRQIGEVANIWLWVIEKDFTISLFYNSPPRPTTVLRQSWHTLFIVFARQTFSTFP